jgi:hypothetical protein
MPAAENGSKDTSAKTHSAAHHRQNLTIAEQGLLIVEVQITLLPSPYPSWHFIH